jgi:hypothetical protein
MNEFILGVAQLLVCIDQGLGTLRMPDARLLVGLFASSLNRTGWLGG